MSFRSFLNSNKLLILSINVSFKIVLNTEKLYLFSLLSLILPHFCSVSFHLLPFRFSCSNVRLKSARKVSMGEHNLVSTEKCNSSDELKWPEKSISIHISMKTHTHTPSEHDHAISFYSTRKFVDLFFFVCVLMLNELEWIAGDFELVWE